MTRSSPPSPPSSFPIELLWEIRMLCAHFDRATPLYGHIRCSLATETHCQRHRFRNRTARTVLDPSCVGHALSLYCLHFRGHMSSSYTSDNYVGNGGIRNSVRCACITRNSPGFLPSRFTTAVTNAIAKCSV